MVALDADFDTIQQQIASLESRISNNEAIGVELEKYYRAEKMEPTALSYLERRKKETESDIRGYEKMLVGCPVGKTRAELEARIAARQAEVAKISVKVEGVTAILQNAR